MRPIRRRGHLWQEKSSEVEFVVWQFDDARAFLVIAPGDAHARALYGIVVLSVQLEAAGEKLPALRRAEDLARLRFVGEPHGADAADPGAGGIRYLAVCRRDEGSAGIAVFQMGCVDDAQHVARIL